MFYAIFIVHFSDSADVVFVKIVYAVVCRRRPVCEFSEIISVPNLFSKSFRKNGPEKVVATDNTVAYIGLNL